MKLPLITTYSNLQLRLGYLKIVAALGTRFPTTQHAFEDKLAKLFPAPPPKKGHGLGVTAQKQALPSSYIERLGVRRGILNKTNVSEIVTLAKAFEFIHPQNCSLYEIAVVVQSIMGAQAIKAIIEQDATIYNPLTIGAADDDSTEKALFMTLILRSDLPTAILACAVAGSTHPFHLYDCFPKTAPPKQKTPAYSDKSLLLDVFELIDEWRKHLGSEALSLTNWKDWEKYFQGHAVVSPFGGKPEYRMGKRSSYRHHAAPRLEFLVDLGLLERESNQKEDDHDGGSDSGSYHATATTRRFSEYLRTHLKAGLDVAKFIRERAIDCYAATYGFTLSPATEAEQLEFLVAGFQEVKREIGSTPMWTTGLVSSLLALKERIRIEIADFYELAKKLSIQEGAKVKLSGGSRFDGEFLITIAPDLSKGFLGKAT